MNTIFPETESKNTDAIFAKNMVFTSAGDNTNFIKWWCSENAEYDIYVIYYGNNNDNYNIYSRQVKFIEKDSGSKFQNFLKFYNRYPNIIDKYDRFFILDDDIEITADHINTMFNISKKYELSICAPCFNHNSCISWPITKQKPGVFLEYTNFVEVNTPLFDKTALVNTIKWLDPTLIGWGIDILYIWANGIDEKKKYAIIHSVSCYNPDRQKDNNRNRELFKIKGAEKRQEIWETYAQKIGCPKMFKFIAYETYINNTENGSKAYYD